MSKHFSHDLTYDATLEEVTTMLADPAFREEVCDFQRVRSRTVTIEPTDDGAMTVRIDQVQAARGIPSFAQKIVGESINLIQSERWSSPTRATLEIEIPGKPGEMKGGVSIVETGGRVVETVEFTAKVAIPLVGGKLETLIGDLLIKALRAENKVGRDWLSRV